MYGTLLNQMDALTSSESDELSKYDIYGRTPPRTKILRKNRERKNRYSRQVKHHI